ncbi:hypothetical protein SAMN05216600_10515 [Pseudomonas cuatrocienegasensis]|uniref:Uncharacterized protein n=1 Tax=Pseudomonas cuatrocienegasensis TaxID=543360 RepID=A0ABY1B9Q1_9PSED|nr:MULTISPECIES: hypothetical protein [Pseudomonas]OEC35310.1 hypothetical protein A7D25_09300 [Pseudomonas sp. 21C1]SEQ31624.1 hypothetical protein SAMN05216600_10515 [Pseudomonas cuatrocienegasensis]
MESESLVYGCIRDWPGDDTEQSRQRRASNRAVLAQLPEDELGPLLGREMFSVPAAARDVQAQSQVIHFGASYQAVEYEWSLWIQQFEALLKRLYWVSAVVHLETELNGTHTFRWESDNGLHSPDEGELRVRCAWEREGGVRG